MSIPGDCVESPASIISNIESEYLLGIIRLSDRLIILLDLDKVLSHIEKDQLMEMPPVANPGILTFRKMQMARWHLASAWQM